MANIIYPPFDLDAALAGEPVAYGRAEEGDNREIVPTRTFVRESMLSPGLLYVVEGSFGVDLISLHELKRQAVGMWTISPPTFAHWDVLSPKIGALAMDSDGTWFCYFAAPKMVNDNRKKTKYKDGGWWYSSGGYRMEVLLHPDMLPVCAKENWRHSLILRPETIRIAPDTGVIHAK